MNNIKTPLEIDDILENIYAGFWIRFAAYILDMIFFLPITLITIFLEGYGKYSWLFALLFGLTCNLFYRIYLMKKINSSPGKLLLGLKIIKINGQNITWKEVILRNAVGVLLTLISSVMLIYCLFQTDSKILENLNWKERNEYLTSFSTTFFKIHNWTLIFWILIEFISLMTNKRKREINDFIAKTVVVRTKFIDRIRSEMKIEN